MKKVLLSGFALSLGAFAMAQSSNTGWKAPELAPWQKNYTVEIKLKPDGAMVPVQADEESTGSGPAPLGSTTATNETVIGETTYDLQTNASVQRRIVNHGNGNIGAVWTYSSSNTTGFGDRGTGYNFFNGTSWNAAPSARIEPERVGWPNLLDNQSGAELVYAHNTAADEIAKSERSTIGSGTWTTVGQVLDGQVWSRAAIGGANNNSVHMFALTLPTDIQGGNPGMIYNGMDGALLYNRSTDGGATWDITNLQLPEMTDVEYEGIGGDNYALDTRGDVIAFVEGSLGYGVTLWKSMDNGSNWTKIPVLISDVVRFDEETSFINTDFADAVYTSDGSVSVLIDDNDQCHVWFGRMFISNGTVNDQAIGFFPFQNGIDYWNEANFVPGEDLPVTIAGAPDLNGNGGIDITSQAALASYRFQGLAGMPQAGIDANGCIYVTYQAVHEELFSGAQNYRHPFIVSSCDGGCTWTEPVDLMEDGANDFSEGVFPSIARLVDSKAHVVVQKDFEPGYHVAGDEDPIGPNEIVYIDIDATDVTSQAAFVCPTFISGISEFCPGDQVTLTASCGTAWAWSNGQTTQTITADQNDYGTLTCTTTTACGQQTDTIELTQPFNTPVIAITADADEICPGDIVNLEVNQVTSGSYLWSTGATMSSIDINNPGSYTVTVTNCGGTSVETITITQPTSVGPVEITGPNTICPGQTITLNVTTVTGGSYLWSTGSTSSSTTVTASGTVTVTVTNCAPGNATQTFTVDPEPAPTASISALDSITEVCFGESVTLVAEGGATYLWSNGATTASIFLTDVQSSQAYTVTTTNACGVSSAASNTINVTVNSLPATPSISYNGQTFTSSASGTHAWFIDGVVQTGEIGSSFFPADDDAEGKLITATVTDANGCTSEGSVGVTGIENAIRFGESVSVFPNPTNGEFSIQFNEVTGGSYTIVLTDLVGKTVRTEQIAVSGTHTEFLSYNDLPSGTYLLTVKGQDSEATEMLIIE